MADPGAYSRRIEILRMAATRDDQGGSAESYSVLKKAWSKPPGVSAVNRSDVNDRDVSSNRCEYILRKEAAESVAVGDFVRDRSVIALITRVFPTSDDETTLTVQQVTPYAVEE